MSQRKRNRSKWSCFESSWISQLLLTISTKIWRLVSIFKTSFKRNPSTKPSDRESWDREIWKTISCLLISSRLENEQCPKRWVEVWSEGISSVKSDVKCIEHTMTKSQSCRSVFKTSSRNQSQIFRNVSLLVRSRLGNKRTTWLLPFAYHARPQLAVGLPGVWDPARPVHQIEDVPDPALAWGQIRDVFHKRNNAVPVGMTYLPRSGRWYILYASHATARGVFPRLFCIDSHGALRPVAKENAVFGAGWAGEEFLAFAMERHVGRGFDIHRTPHWLYSVPEVFMDWVSEFIARYVLRPHRRPSWVPASRRPLSNVSRSAPKTIGTRWCSWPTLSKPIVRPYGGNSHLLWRKVQE